jgi:hypothetical protein
VKRKLWCIFEAVIETFQEYYLLDRTRSVSRIVVGPRQPNLNSREAEVNQFRTRFNRESLRSARLIEAFRAAVAGRKTRQGTLVRIRTISAYGSVPFWETFEKAAWDECRYHVLPRMHCLVVQGVCRSL